MPSDNFIALRRATAGARAALAALVLGLLALPAAATAEVTVWNFDNVVQPLQASVGPALMAYYDPDFSNWGDAETSFDTTSSLALPPLPGGDGSTRVMMFPATTPTQGYSVLHGADPNGSQANAFGAVANYTLVFDIYFPSSSDGQWRNFYQTNPLNQDDGEFFAQNQPSGGVGIGGNYLGSLTPDAWHRVAVSVRAADGEGQMHKFIDGQFVGGQGTTGSAISSRWGLDSFEFLLFADENNETAPGAVSSIMFVDRQMTIEELGALGGPNPAGANVPGTTAPPLEKLPRAVEHIIAHRGRSCCAPENTVAAIDAAFDAGATAIEIDLHTSFDGVAVLMHDGDLLRTTDGAGSVNDFTVAELKQLDAGSWFDPTFAGETIPTLAEALVAAHGRGRLLLDTKQGGMGAAIAQALLDATALIQETHPGEVIDATAIWPWSGGSQAAVDDYFNNIPNVETVHGAPPSPLDAAGFNALKAKGVVGFDVGIGTATAPFIDAAHENDMFVTAYTVLDPDVMRELVLRGVDGMETDFPGILASISPVAGDVTGEGDVTIDDYFVIRDHYFSQVNSPTLGDITGDGLVDFSDFYEWLVNFPGGPDQARAAIAGAVPEPAGAWLALSGAVALLHFRPRTMRRRGVAPPAAR